jgi:hypothetical protein
MTTKAGSFRFRFWHVRPCAVPCFEQPRDLTTRSHVQRMNIDVVDELRRFGESRENFRYCRFAFLQQHLLLKLQL